MTGAANNLLDRIPVPGQAEDDGISIFSTKVSFILNLLGGG